MKGLGAVIFLSLILACGGCGGEPPKPTKVSVPPVQKATITPAKIPPSVTAELKVEPPSLITYTYNPTGKPNPFKPLIVERPEVPPKKGAEVGSESGTPLEKMELNQLKLVAIIWNTQHPKAMVEDGTGRGYIIANGTSIGKNKGEVTQITSAGVVVREKYETSLGKFSAREVTLKLYAD
jgi:type IV pilus assembly protein PilP